jgi:hypothetical protein
MKLGDWVCNLLLQVQQKVAAAGSWPQCVRKGGSRLPTIRRAGAEIAGGGGSCREPILRTKLRFRPLSSGKFVPRFLSLTGKHQNGPIRPNTPAAGESARSWRRRFRHQVGKGR